MMDQVHDCEKVPGMDRVIHVAGFEPRKHQGLVTAELRFVRGMGYGFRFVNNVGRPS